MIDNETLNGSEAYTLTNLFTDLRNGIWSELRTGRSIDTYRRNLQRAHVEKLGSILTAKNVAGFRGNGVVTVKESDIIPMVKAELKRLRRDAQRAANASNGLRRNHLQDIAERIDAMLDPK